MHMYVYLQYNESVTEKVASSTFQMKSDGIRIHKLHVFFIFIMIWEYI